MRRIKKLFIVSGLLFGVLFAQEPVTYTIEGKKDPRLEARFRVLYVSTGTSKECTSTKLSTGTRKPMIGARVFEVKDENYSIQIPIALEEDENNCGYSFRRIELVMNRLYDDDLYSLHILLDSYPEARAIYYGRRGGMGSNPSPDMPAKLLTDKTYYRIAEDTRFFCRTDWTPKIRLPILGANGKVEWKDSEHTNFHCIMQIEDGKGENTFIYPDPQLRYATNPALGIDTLKSETLHVDIIADDEGSMAIEKGIIKDYFRTLPKPEPIAWEKVKSLF